MTPPYRILRAWIDRSRQTYAGAPLALAALAVVCFAALVVFVALPIEPFGYYKDLGFDHMVTDWAAHSVRSPLDFIDALGWSPWNGTQLFYLNSYAPILLSAPLSVLVGNAWLAIKIIQLLQVLIAAGSAFALYRTARRSSFWACIFAFTYAALPTTELAVRGNVGLGWIAALLPASIVIGRLLVIRFGPRALPAAAIVCGLFGYVIAIEYLAFVSLPALAMIMASTPPSVQHDKRRLLFFGPLAFLCLVSIGAYFLVPTFSHPLFSDATARTTTLLSGAFLDNFSETAIGLLTLVPRESLVSPIQQFNAITSLPLLYVAGTLWWIAAIAFVMRTRERFTFSNPWCLSIVIACTLLALGEELPGGRAIWSALFLIPHVDAIRTTDRFIVIPALFVVFWATLAFERIARSSALPRRIAAWLAVGLLASTIAFDVNQHCFTVEPNVGTRMPQLNDVRRAVLAIGGRTASFASINGGSREDAAEYGVPAPISAAYLDLGSRFLTDGIGASGVLGRTATRSVITSPNWTYDTPEVPPSTAVYRNVLRASSVFNSPEGVRVWRIPARDMIGVARVDCVFGGPGAFDQLDVDANLTDISFADPGARCDRTGLVDFEPADDWPRLHALAHWSGATLFPGEDRLRDIDYPYVPNRILLAMPWYRNSIDGARSDFDPAGAARIDDATTTLHADAMWPAGSTIAIRLAAPRGGSIAFRATYGAQERTLVADPRLRWYRFRLEHAIQPNEEVGLEFRTDGERPDVASAYAGIALDGVVVLPRSVPDVAYDTAFAVISADELEAQSRLRDDETGAGELVLVAMAAMHADYDGNAPILNVDASDATARYRWDGPPGTYELQVAADSSADPAALTIQTDCCIGRSITNPARQRSLALTRSVLHRGSIVTVRVSSSRFQPAKSIDIVAVEAHRVEPVRLSGSESTSDLDFRVPLTALARADETSGGRMTADGFEGGPGTSLAFDVLTDPSSDALVANLARLGDGIGVLELVCGGASTTSIVTSASVSASISVGHATRCHGRLDWQSGSFVLTNLTLSDIGARRPPLHGDVWFPAGRFLTTSLAADGTQRPVELRTRECRRTECEFATNGYRTVSLDSSSPGERLVLIRDGERSRPRAPVVEQTAAIRWSVTLPRRSDLVVAQLYDGNWHAESNGAVFAGEPCDITSTCFPGLAAGTYRVYHTWSPALLAGTIVTFGTIALAGIFMLPISRRLPRSAAAMRRRSAYRTIRARAEDREEIAEPPGAICEN